MGGHFVSLNGETGFWMSDGIARFWIFLLASHIDGDFEPTSIGAQIRTQWMDASKLDVSGVVWDGLGSYGKDPEARRIIATALDQLTSALEAAPDLIPSEMISILGFDIGSGSPIRTVRLLELSRAWSDLLNERLTLDVRNAPEMPDPIWVEP
jgi:hypothetical protein